MVIFSKKKEEEEEQQQKLLKSILKLCKVESSLHKIEKKSYHDLYGKSKLNYLRGNCPHNN